MTLHRLQIVACNYLKYTIANQLHAVSKHKKHLVGRQPNPVFWHNLASESIVVFKVELAFQGHYLKESFYWTTVSIEHFAYLQNVIKPKYAQ